MYRARRLPRSAINSQGANERQGVMLSVSCWLNATLRLSCVVVDTINNSVRIILLRLMIVLGHHHGEEV